jgi:hypothetical protein
MAVQLGARLVAVRDAALALLVTAIAPAEPDEVTGDWIAEEDIPTLEGRKTFVLPAGAVTVQRATRAKLSTSTA